MKIAISGAGIAGPTLAHWLHRNGHEPVLIEHAPQFRTGGYAIDFWGVGYAVAERMGILSQVLEAGYSFEELRLVDTNGHRVAGFPTDSFRRLTNGRFTTIPRGDLSAAINRTIEGQVEVVFGDSIADIEEAPDGVRVAFEHGRDRAFDLLVGADGLHSKVRQLVFGPEDRFETQLGYRVASFAVRSYRPRDETFYVAHAAPELQFARIALRDDWTIFLFVFDAALMKRPEPTNVAERRAVLHDVFADAGWEARQMLATMDEVDDIYFDRVSQIKMPAWSKGRVMLIGDAAAAVSLLAGEGTGLAMTAGYVLAGELSSAGEDHEVAFANHETRLRPLIEAKQAAAAKFAASFLPKSASGIWLRNQATKLMHVPAIADFLISHSVSLKDDFDLPDYRMAPTAGEPHLDHPSAA